MDEEPTLPPPVYAPDVVARAILHCAETPEREVTVGGGGKSIAAMAMAPRIADKVMEATLTEGPEEGGAAEGNPAGAAARPDLGMKERGDYPGHVFKSSAYTAASLHPVWTGLLAVGAGLAIAALVVGDALEREARVAALAVADQGTVLGDLSVTRRGSTQGVPPAPTPCGG